MHWALVSIGVHSGFACMDSAKGSQLMWHDWKRRVEYPGAIWHVMNCGDGFDPEQKMS
jgi:hypothetical protein